MNRGPSESRSNLSEPLKRALVAEADRERRSMSFIVVLALRDYLKGKTS